MSKRKTNFKTIVIRMMRVVGFNLQQYAITYEEITVYIQNKLENNPKIERSLPLPNPSIMYKIY